jgi:nondiscriminating aspartyl-tRNA synthetase
MTGRLLVSQLKDHIGETVTVAGFAQAIRRQGGVVFLILRDRSGLVQTLTFKSAGDIFTALQEVSIESVVRVTGELKDAPQAMNGFEIAIESFEVLSKAEPELPIPVVAQKGADDVEFSKQLDWRFINLRQPQNLRIFEVWTAMEEGLRNYFNGAGYLQIYTPALLSTASETGSEVFEVKYFERKAYLAQSPQFHKQMAMAAGFERVFMTGPVFRAEPSFTSRHMTEFTGWDFELSYVDDHFEVMAEEEKALAAAFEKAYAVVEEPEFDIPTLPFPKLTFAEVKARLTAAGITSGKADDLNPEEERAICAMIKEEFNHDFLFITDYPISIRPFYHMRHEDNPELTKSFDLLYRGLEITTGAQREHRIDVLEKQAIEKGMSLEELSDYISFFRYGCPPHGGGGIGPARIVRQMLNLANVKEATFLPRDVKRLTP